MQSDVNETLVESNMKHPQFGNVSYKRKIRIPLKSHCANNARIYLSHHNWERENKLNL